MKRNLPVRDARTRAEARRALGRALDFNPVVQDSAPVNEAAIKGVKNAHIYTSAGVHQLCLQIDGVYWRVALTSAF